MHATGSVPNAFTYIGAPSDPSTGLVYLNARYLDPATGRLISEDPVPAADPYPYASDDPTNLTDPTGRDDEDLDELAEVEVVDGEVSSIEDRYTVQVTQQETRALYYQLNSATEETSAGFLQSIAEYANDVGDVIETVSTAIHNILDSVPVVPSAGTQSIFVTILSIAIVMTKLVQVGQIFLDWLSNLGG